MIKRCLLCLLLLVWAAPLMAQDAEVLGGDDAQLRAFIGRLLTGYGQVTSPPQVLIGGLPDLPFNLPLPDPAQVLGSVIRPQLTVIDAAPTVFAEIYLQTQQSPAALSDFFNSAFASAPWSAQQVGESGPNGFIQTLTSYGNYCYNGAEAFVNFDAFDDGTGTILVMRTQVPADPFQCSGSADFYIETDAVSLIPPLGDVAGVRILENVASTTFYTARGVSLFAVIEADIPLASVLSAYNARLLEAGWSLASEESGQLSAVSLWTLLDPSDGSPFTGMLSIVSNPARPQEFSVTISVDRAAAG